MLAALEQEEYKVLAPYINGDILQIGQPFFHTYGRPGKFRLSFAFPRMNKAGGIEVRISLSYVVKNYNLSILGVDKHYRSGTWCNVTSAHTDLSLLIQGGYVKAAESKGIVKWTLANLNQRKSLPLKLESDFLCMLEDSNNLAYYGSYDYECDLKLVCKNISFKNAAQLQSGNLPNSARVLSDLPDSARVLSIEEMLAM
jgi:hypothetical protein